MKPPPLPAQENHAPHKQTAAEQNGITTSSPAPLAPSNPQIRLLSHPQPPQTLSPPPQLPLPAPHPLPAKTLLSIHPIHRTPLASKPLPLYTASPNHKTKPLSLSLSLETSLSISSLHLTSACTDGGPRQEKARCAESEEGGGGDEEGRRADERRRGEEGERREEGKVVVVAEVAEGRVWEDHSNCGGGRAEEGKGAGAWAMAVGEGSLGFPFLPSFPSTSSLPWFVRGAS